MLNRASAMLPEAIDSLFIKVVEATTPYEQHFAVLVDGGCWDFTYDRRAGDRRAAEYRAEGHRATVVPDWVITG